ncbi:hypothetical protein ACOMHN_039564 [Nucella lapillus]
MADGGGDSLPANCGVTIKKDKVVLTYKVGKNVNKKDITWEWCEEGTNYVARLKATTNSGDVKYHNSAPIDADTFSKLGKADKSMDGEFYKVKMSKTSDTRDLHELFDVPQ